MEVFRQVLERERAVGLAFRSASVGSLGPIDRNHLFEHSSASFIHQSATCEILNRRRVRANGRRKGRSGVFAVLEAEKAPSTLSAPQANVQRENDLAAGLVEVPEIKESESLFVEGDIPPYLIGRLYFTGPGAFEILHADGNVRRFKHWFDGVGTMHSFSIDAAKGTVLYKSRRFFDVVSKTVKQIAADSFKMITFGETDPPLSFFGKVRRLFRPFTKNPMSRSMNLVNVNVTVQNIPTVQEVVIRTDLDVNVVLNEDTLEVKRIFSFSEMYPQLAGEASASHGQYDEETGEFFNFSFRYGKDPVVYKVFRINASGMPDILAEFKDSPRLIHSFGLTPNYVILALGSLVLNPLSTLYTTTITESTSFMKNLPSKFYVISRSQRRIVAVYESDAFFFFHNINAYESNDGNQINMDICYYENADITRQLCLQKMKTDKPETFSNAEVMRFEFKDLRKAKDDYSRTKSILPAHRQKLTSAIVEFPVVAPSRMGKPYRYTYGVSNGGEFGETLFSAIVKVDVTTGEKNYWSVPRGACSEPIFIPDPAGGAEDSGTLLTIVLDAAAARSFLAFVDARTMTERARAIVSQPVPLTFHGKYVSS